MPKAGFPPFRCSAVLLSYVMSSPSVEKQEFDVTALYMELITSSWNPFTKGVIGRGVKFIFSFFLPKIKPV